MSELNIHIDDRRTPPPSPAVAGVVDDLLVIAQQGALVSNLAFANQVRNTDLAGQAQATRQQGMDRLQLAILAQASCRTTALTPPQARAAVEVLSGNELAQALADLRATAAALGAAR